MCPVAVTISWSAGISLLVVSRLGRLDAAAARCTNREPGLAVGAVLDPHRAPLEAGVLGRQRQAQPDAQVAAPAAALPAAVEAIEDAARGRSSGTPGPSSSTMIRMRSSSGSSVAPSGGGVAVVASGSTMAARWISMRVAPSAYLAALSMKLATMRTSRRLSQ